MADFLAREHSDAADRGQEKESRGSERPGSGPPRLTRCGFCVVFLSRSQRLVSFLSFCVVVAAFTFEVSGQQMGGDGFQTQKKKSWIPGHVRAEKLLADAITIDGRKEWRCKFCSETSVWTRWRCRRCYSTIPAWGGHLDRHPRVVEEGKPRDQDKEIRELRAQCEQLRRQQRVEKGQGVQGD